MTTQPLKAMVLGLAACTVGLGPGMSAATDMADIEGAEDPSDFERFPGSWIVDYSPSTSQRAYVFITGKVARIRREVRIDRSVRVQAELQRVTYRTPAGTRLDDVIAHYQAVVGELGARVEFTCRGLDCGHSTIWANQVFGVKELAAPDAAQFYVAAAAQRSEGSRLVSIYVAQRANRRVYAHVDIADAKSSEASGSRGDLPGDLASRGYAVLSGVAPDSSGNLDAGDLELLDSLVPELAPFAGKTMFVVCHLGNADAARAVELSKACAETAAKRLGDAGVEATGFGAGALLPREGAPVARLELVIPGTERSR